MAAAQPTATGVETDEKGLVMTAFLLVSAGFIFLTLVVPT